MGELTQTQEVTRVVIAISLPIIVLVVTVAITLTIGAEQTRKIKTAKEILKRYGIYYHWEGVGFYEIHITETLTPAQMAVGFEMLRYILGKGEFDEAPSSLWGDCVFKPDMRG